MDIEQMVEKVTNRVITQLQVSSENYFILGSRIHRLEQFLTDNGIGVSYSIDEARNSKGKIIFSVSSLKSFIRISNLIAMNPLEDFIIDCILTSQGLYIEETFECPRNKQVLELLSEAKTRLIKLGVIFVDSTNYADYFLTKKSSIKDDLGIQVQMSREPITLDKISSYHFGSSKQFIVKPNMILTALAKDYLRENQIEIVKEF